MTVLEVSSAYSADRALVALEIAYCDVEAKRAACLMLPTFPLETDAISNLAHTVKARLVEGFEALAAQPADPWTRFDQLRRAADLLGPDAPIVGRIASALSIDQARLAAAEAA